MTTRTDSADARAVIAAFRSYIFNFRYTVNLIELDVTSQELSHEIVNILVKDFTHIIGDVDVSTKEILEAIKLRKQKTKSDSPGIILPSPKPLD